MSRKFDGNVVWITGGGTGIGRSLAIEMAREGAIVAVSGRRPEPLEEVTGTITGAGGKAMAVVCDVTSEDSLREAVGKIAAELGRLDIAVANAGFGVMGRVENLTAGDWHRQFETNVVGAALTARAALPELYKTKGRMVLVASVAAYVTTPSGAAYSASKAALRAIGDALSLELKGTGVTCTTIHPGFVESDIARVDNNGVFHADWKDRRPARLMWTGEAAARVMANAILARKREFVFTMHGKFAVMLKRFAPSLLHLIIGQVGIPEKNKIND